MASLVGVHLGRTRWPRSRKTLEGSLAAVASMLLLLALLLHLGGELPRRAAPWAALAAAVALAAVLEAATSQIDNLFLPLFFCSVLLALAG